MASGLSLSRSFRVVTHIIPKDCEKSRGFMIICWNNYIINSKLCQWSIRYANMKQKPCGFHGAAALPPWSEAHTNLDLSRRLASQDEVLLHFSCTAGALHCNQKRKSSPLDCFRFWRRRWDSNPRAILLATRFRVRSVTWKLSNNTTPISPYFSSCFPTLKCFRYYEFSPWPLERRSNTLALL